MTELHHVVNDNIAGDVGVGNSGFGLAQARCNNLAHVGGGVVGVSSSRSRGRSFRVSRRGSLGSWGKSLGLGDSGLRGGASLDFTQESKNIALQDAALGSGRRNLGDIVDVVLEQEVGDSRRDELGRGSGGGLLSVLGLLLGCYDTWTYEQDSQVVSFSCPNNTNNDGVPIIDRSCWLLKTATLLKGRVSASCHVLSRVIQPCPFRRRYRYHPIYSCSPLSTLFPAF